MKVTETKFDFSGFRTGAPTALKVLAAGFELKLLRENPYREFIVRKNGLDFELWTRNAEEPQPTFVMKTDLWRILRLLGYKGPR